MGFELTTLVVIDTDCTSSCKSNYHTITTTTEWYGRNPNEFVLYCTSCAIIFYFQTSSNLAVSSAKGSYNKEKQSNIKYAAWAAHQLKERYQVYC
jgi:hypothetical protein